MGYYLTKKSLVEDLVLDIISSEKEAFNYYDIISFKHRLVKEKNQHLLWMLDKVIYRRDYDGFDIPYKAGQVVFRINLFVISKDGSIWDYKLIAECQEPPYYSCPLSYLKIANDVPINQAWRDKVKEFHRQARRVARGV